MINYVVNVDYCYTYYLFLQIPELQFISNDFVEITFEWHMWDNKKSGNTKEDIFITS